MKWGWWRDRNWQTRCWEQAIAQVKAQVNAQAKTVLPGLVVVLGVVGLRTIGALQAIELTALDSLLRWRLPEPLDERVLVVGITEADIQQVKQYPLSDRELANLLRTLQKFRPSAIGLDIVRDLPVEPGHAELVQVFRTSPNLIAAEIALPDVSGRAVAPPPSIPREQVGFADAVLDVDGSLRRSLLVIPQSKDSYQFSLAVRLVDTYLAAHHPNLFLENGWHDPLTLRIGATEFPRVLPTTGGYMAADVTGIQTMLNFRSGRHPFRQVSLTDLKTGRVPPEWIRDRIVLVGVTAFSVKDQVLSGAIPLPDASRGMISGVEVHAHMISQVLSSVLDGRSSLQSLSDLGELVWIVGWSMAGIGVGIWMQARQSRSRQAIRSRSPWRGMILLGGVGVGLVSSSYGLLLLGWWVPLVPPLLILALNGTGLIAQLFYRAEQILERQQTIEDLFTEIHNRPLQTLKNLQRELPTQTEITPEAPSESLSKFVMQLQQVDRELRSVYDSARQELLHQSNQLRLSGDRALDLQAPLHEVLYAIYCETLERDFPHFKPLKVKIVQFEPMDTQRLSLTDKRGLCRFLEEALCNVGKYALGATRLTIVCAPEGDRQVIRVTDNGIGLGQSEQFVDQLDQSEQSADRTSGFGTQQAKNLAKRLRGKFQRVPNDPKGTICELTWTTQRVRPWQFW